MKRIACIAALLLTGTAAAQESVTRKPDATSTIQKEPGGTVSQTPETAPTDSRSPWPPVPEIPPSPPLPSGVGEMVAPQRPPTPDEGRLWRLFQQRRFDALEKTIRDYRSAYPRWHPPGKLTGLVARERDRMVLRGKVNANDPEGLMRLFERRPGLFGCSEPDATWAVAEAYADRAHWSGAAEIYGELITRCSLAIARASLQKASLRLPRSDFDRLRATVDESPHASELSDTMHGLAYERHKRALLSAHETGDHGTVDRLSAELAGQLESTRDAGLAGMLGWDYFNRRRYDEAIHWFALALDWEPGQDDWRYGLALSQFKAQRTDAAVASIGSAPADPRLRQLLGDVYLDRAWKAFRDDELDAAANDLARATPYLRDRRSADALDAWLHYRRGEYELAAASFEQLYRREPSPEVAQGLVLSYAKFAPERLDNLVDGNLEPLKSAIAAQTAGELYERKLFLAAHKAAPDAYPDLENIDGRSLAMGTMVRHKSGESGQGRLTIWHRPFAEGTYVHNGVNRFAFKATALDLDGGKPDDCANFGSKPEGCNDYGLIRDRAPLAGVHDAALLDFSYYREGWTSPYLNIGTTPLNGPVGPVPTFRLGVIQQESWGRWQAEAFNQPVRLSVLSYVGQQDPYSNKNWGRVVETGGALTAYHQIDERWGLHGQLVGTHLSGQRVADNWMVGASLAAGYDLRLPGFDYFSLGPSVLYQHYDQTLSQFTLGHGGYFSPDQFVNAGLSVNFLTEEGKPLIGQGRMTVGYQYYRDSVAPWFPLGAPGSLPNGRYSPSSYDGIAYDLELKGAWLVAPNWMIAAGAAVRQTSGFQDYFGGLSISFLLDSRKAAFSSDIPDSFFRALY